MIFLYLFGCKTVIVIIVFTIMTGTPCFTIFFGVSAWVVHALVVHALVVSGTGHLPVSGYFAASRRFFV